MASKKRRRREERPTIHPKNKYSENPPDFALLASIYPSFEPFVFYSRDGRPRINWTDFNATRELTRILLLHDHGLNWWIPDGQLCPTVPNRSNYIHWIEDLLSSDIIPKSDTRGNNVRGFDIGTGANCIYPLLGASLLGWSFVGSGSILGLLFSVSLEIHNSVLSCNSQLNFDVVELHADVTDVALEWAEKNIKSNPQILELIEIRKVESCQNTSSSKEPHNGEPALVESKLDLSGHVDKEAEPLPSPSFDQPTAANKSYHGPPVLAGVVRDGEKFDFCMCNPPFFETMEEAGLNPKTSCGGTPEEMVCPGGERAFITRIIEDSVELKQTFRWYTSMVGRKLNLKFLISKLREVGVTIVKTTEFVQGQTYRWGLAWSFVPPARKIVSTHVAEKKNLSFMLEGVQRQFSAIDVLHSIESFFCTSGASCMLNASSFTIDITALKDHCNAILKNEVIHVDETASGQNLQETSNSSSCLDTANSLYFRVSVFQQIPGTLLVKGSLHRDSVRPGLFSSIFQQLEEELRCKFCREKGSVK